MPSASVTPSVGFGGGPCDDPSNGLCDDLGDGSCGGPLVGPSISS